MKMGLFIEYKSMVHEQYTHFAVGRMAIKQYESCGGRNHFGVIQRRLRIGVVTDLTAHIMTKNTRRPTFGKFPDVGL